jgi:capsule biosynthesis phosphatase
MPTIVMDLDGTLTIDDHTLPYPDRPPNTAMVEKLREYRAAGFLISIYTARNMKTHAKSVGRINAHTLPIIIDWLRKHDVPFDEIYVGKPWADEGGFYVDDRAIRPAEFLALSHSEIMALTGASA